MAAQAAMPVTPHCANLSLVTLFTMHLLKSISNGGKYLEYSIESEDYYPWQANLFETSPYCVEGGCVPVGREPGWGVEINREWLAKSQYACSEIA